MGYHLIDISPPSAAARNGDRFSPATLWSIVLLLVAAPLGAGSADAQVVIAPATARWVPATLFPHGAMLSVVSGDPSRPGQSTAELLLPDGYVVPAHFHPMGERLEVREGTLLVGTGDRVDLGRVEVLSPGDTAFAPAGSHHYWVARGRTVIALTFEGPYTITYVHAHQAPRRATFPFQY